ncbi:MAG: TlpA disulfide reductase family protein [Bacteroidia bacterium]
MWQHLFYRFFLPFLFVIIGSGISYGQNEPSEGQEYRTQTDTLTDFQRDFSNLKKADIHAYFFRQNDSVRGDEIPCYLEETGELLTGWKKERVSYIIDLWPFPYIDSTGRIRAVVYGTLTEEQKESHIKMGGEEYRTMTMGKYREGVKAPSIDVEDMTGISFTPENLKDKVVVLNFWFTGCKPCIEEMPALNELVMKYLDEEVVFLGFALDDEESLRLFFEQHPYYYHTISNADQVHQQFEVKVWPSHIIVGRDSNIYYRSAGFNDGTIILLDEAIQEAILQN